MKSIKKKYTPAERLDILAGLRGGLKHLAKSHAHERGSRWHDVFICLAISFSYDLEEITSSQSASAKRYIHHAIGKQQTLNEFVMKQFGFRQATNTKVMQKYRRAMLKLMIKGFEKATKTES